MVLLEEIEVVGGSSFKACSTEIDDDNEDEIFPCEVNEENRPLMSDVSVEADSDSEYANCPLNESLSSCSSLDTVVKAVPKKQEVEFRLYKTGLGAQNRVLK